VGVNLFPDRKVCNFNCPYCEVFPFSNKNKFSLPQMKEDLVSTIRKALQERVPVRDICFSGNGEPTLSPFFFEALEEAARLRDELAPKAHLVLITNGSSLGDKNMRQQLHEAAAGPWALRIWLKLDAGTPSWYEKINRSTIPYEKLISGIREFSSYSPLSFQTMICGIEGGPPPEEEERAWEKLLIDLVGRAGGTWRRQANRPGGRGIRSIMIYGKARPAPDDPLAAALPDEYLEKRAASLRAAMGAVYFTGAPPVEVYK